MDGTESAEPRILEVAGRIRCDHFPPSPQMRCLPGFPSSLQVPIPYEAKEGPGGEDTQFAGQRPAVETRATERNRTYSSPLSSGLAQNGCGSELRGASSAQAAFPVIFGGEAPSVSSPLAESSIPASAVRPRLTRLFTVPSLQPRMLPASS